MAPGPPLIFSSVLRQLAKKQHMAPVPPLSWAHGTDNQSPPCLFMTLKRWQPHWKHAACMAQQINLQCTSTTCANCHLTNVVVHWEWSTRRATHRPSVTAQKRHWLLASFICRVVVPSGSSTAHEYRPAPASGSDQTTFAGSSTWVGRVGAREARGWFGG
jgi:hypothetical protein